MRICLFRLKFLIKRSPREKEEAKMNAKLAAASAAHAASARSSCRHVVWVVAVLPAPPCTASCCTSTTSALVSPAPGTGWATTVGPAGGSPVRVESSPVKLSTWNRNGSRRLGWFWRFVYCAVLEPNNGFGEVVEHVEFPTFSEVHAIRTNCKPYRFQLFLHGRGNRTQA